MAAKEDFKVLYSRYLKRLYLKIALVSALISLSALLTIATIFWITGFKYFWISFIVFALVFAGSFLVLYLNKKPNEREFYNSLEELDLEQRAITMYEYQNDNSLMAQKQRENAKINIERLDSKSFKIKAPIALIVAVSIIFAASMVSSVASGLSANRIIPSVTEAINEAKEVSEEKNKPEYEISFEVKGDGYIDGEIFQLVKEGEDSTPVLAVPEDGWYFQSWGAKNDAFGSGEIIPLAFDDEGDPYKQLTNVKGNHTLYAIFAEIPNSSDENGQPEDDPKRPSDDKPERPSPENPQNPQQDEGNDGGGKYAENNQVIDGSTYYGDSTYDNAYQEAMESMQNGEEGSDDLSKIIGDYYETIEK